GGAASLRQPWGLGGWGGGARGTPVGGGGAGRRRGGNGGGGRPRIGGGAVPPPLRGRGLFGRALHAGHLERIEVAAGRVDQVGAHGSRHARDDDLLAEAIARHGHHAHEIAIAGEQQHGRNARAVE